MTEYSSLWLSILKSGVLRYILVGGWSYIVVTGVTWTLHEWLFFGFEKAFAAGIIVALVINVFLLKKFVFRSQLGYWDTGSKFVITSLAIRALEFSLFVLLTRLEVYYLLASTVSMFLGASTKYIVIKFFVYK